MNLTPLLTADPAIQIHAFSAIAALFIGAFVLWRRKGTPLHKMLGRLWAVLMFVTATSSWFINEIRLVGPFSPIHIFALITYSGLYDGITQIRRGHVDKHSGAMQGLYLGALILAGAFTFLPGRRMYEVFFGAADQAFGMGWLMSLTVIAVSIGLSGLFYWRLRNAA